MRSPRQLGVTLLVFAALYLTPFGPLRRSSAEASDLDVNRSFVLPPPPLAVGLASDPTTISSPSGRIDVFARGTDDALWHIAFSNGQWTAWRSLGGQLASGPDAASWGEGRIDVVARSAANRLLHIVFANGQWSQWRTVATLPAYEPLTSDPSAVSLAPGRVEVFYRGTDGALWTIPFDGQWRSGQRLGNQLAPGSGPAAATPLARAQNGFNPPSQRLDVFIRGTDDALHHRIRDDNGWHAWRSLGGTLTADPAAVSWGTTGRIDVFFRATDGALHSRTFNGYTWFAPQSLGRQVTGGPDASGWGPAGGPDFVSVFARGTDNALHYRALNTYGSSNWQALGTPPDPVVPVNPADLPCPPTPAVPGAGFRVCASPGETPGFKLSPVWTLTGPIGLVSTVRVESVGGFAGIVTLSATCCFDVVTQRWVTLTPSPTGWFSTNPLTIAANGSAATTLNIAVHNAPFSNTPGVPYGKFLMAVEGKHVGGTFTRLTSVGLKKLPENETAPACRRSTPVMTLGPVLDRQIKQREADPGQPQVHEWYGATTPELSIPVNIAEFFDWTITDDHSLSRDEAIIVLKNAGSRIREITSVGCSTPGQGKSIRVLGTQSAEMKIVKGVDNTLIIRERTCGFLFCSFAYMKDWIVFAEPAFWSVFGGKRHIFEWQ